MKLLRENKPAACRLFVALLSSALVMPAPAQASSVALATSPLATSSTVSVKPNLLFVLDDSGSMTWTYMPDDADDFRGSSTTRKYGYLSSQCNGVYYNPDITYTPPVDSAGTPYTDASFTAARDDGFNSGSTARNLNTAFYANRFGPNDSANSTYEYAGSYIGDPLGPYGAVYYVYSGTQTNKKYKDTSSVFYKECNSAVGSTSAHDGVNPVNTLFTKRRLASTMTTTIVLNCSGCSSTTVSSITVNGVELMSGNSATSTSTSTLGDSLVSKITLNGFSATRSGSTITITGPDTAANHTPVITQTGNMTLIPDVFPETTPSKLTNFANWYSFYRTRMLMMKTATGQAFKPVSDKYRVGLMRINSSSAPTLAIDTFDGTQKSDWYSALYGTIPSGSTPLRRALSNAGRYYAGKLSGTDPVQYSCQQNFTLLSTDGYWNSDGPLMVNGSAFPTNDNQDATATRPMFDGTYEKNTVTITYNRNDFSCTGSIPGPDCSSGKKQLKTQPQIASCTVTVAGTPTGGESCTPSSGAWSNTGSATYSGTCTSSCTTPSPDPSIKVETGRVITPAGTIGGAKTQNSLADIAMYYYQTDLRTDALENCTGAISGEDVCTNNVFTSSSDNNIKQHMTTFTLGLGANGRMTYSSSYMSDTTGDFYDVKLGSTASSSVCTWQDAGTVCNWPVPGSDKIENIDDLWHAAINGRGAYFAATNPATLSAGISNALAALNARRGSAAAAATSTLNPVAGNNYAYVASYTTVLWKGNLEARGINTETGVVSENASWCVENVVAGTCPAPGSIVTETSGDTTVTYCATPDSVICPEGILDGSVCKVQMATACTGTMNAKVSDTSDTRTIYTASGGVLTPFDAAYAAANPTYFSEAHIGSLSQWGDLTATQRTAAAGANLVNYLRGQFGYEDRSSNAVDNRLYRYREAVLGDALESQPAFMAKPVFSYPYKGYMDYVTANASRAGTVYMGANDGMMHAFDGDTGLERWAYVPTMVIPSLWKLADKNYSTLHTNYVNGSPITSDVCVSSCDSDSAVWKTILVAGLNGGGRGYYALDITNPTTPVLLWELTTTAGAGTVKDDDIGYGFGHPIITRKADGTWVVLVTSGYNNTSPGNGKGYLYVLNASTGTILGKIDTGVGDTTTPSGLAKIAAWNNDPAGNQTSYVYGGDLLGNVWRFDINSATAATIGTGSVMKFAELKDPLGNPQPITSTPVLGTSNGKRIVMIATGKYLETTDLTSTQTQTLYAIKDDDVTSTLVNLREPTLRKRTLTLSEETATRTGSGDAAGDTFSFATGLGWYVDFPDSGERNHIDSKLVQGVLLVATTVPSNTACSPGGYGWLNFMDYQTGTPINLSTTLVSTKFSSPIVGINVIYIQGKPLVEVVTSGNPTPTIDPSVEFKGAAPTFTGKRVTWRELIP
jgi:type IV pilus assembly protein PilY1